MRNSKIDILRFVGLAMIIAAHSGLPSVLYQLRNFDVPLMVLVSGMSFGLSYKSNETYFMYLWKRFKRLVIPVWIFLTFYFIVLWLFIPGSSDLQIDKIISSYSLERGIDFVWIIRVFFLVALVSPLMFSFHKRTDCQKKYFLFFALIYLAYEILRLYSLPYIQEGAGKSISLISHYIIPYAVIFAIGLRIPQLSKNQVGFLSALNLGIAVLLGIGLSFASGKIVPTQAYKYPPSIYYFSYALFVACFLWVHKELLERLIEIFRIKSFVLFCARNSIWIYLWHIPAVKAVDANYIVKFFIAFSSAVIITYMQVSVVEYFLQVMPNDTMKRNIKAVFAG
ncbi:MAG: acyltransferase [Gammaproteobacteria bacterium]|nr:MAG: acyltransferase [Gammaproteobacteria bacterium]